MIVLFSCLFALFIAMMWFIIHGADLFYERKTRPGLYKKLEKIDLTLATFERVISPIDQWVVFVGEFEFDGFDKSLRYQGLLWELNELPENWQTFLKQYLK